MIQEIDKRFRDKEIVISFPQLDLHIPELNRQDEKTIDAEEAITDVFGK